MKKKIRDLTIGECVDICKKHRVAKNITGPCGDCPLGGYYCNVIFGVRFPEQLENEFYSKRDQPIVTECEIDI